MYVCMYIYIYIYHICIYIYISKARHVSSYMCIVCIEKDSKMESF